MFMGGFGSRLFYNEVPQVSWWRGGGHLFENPEDEKTQNRIESKNQDVQRTLLCQSLGLSKEQFKKLHSFTHANQEYPLIFGIDTTTEEGRKQFKAEFEALAEMAPDLVKKDHLIFPHEMPAFVPNEPHFRRVW